MWTSQVYGHREKMARTKTHRPSQNTEYTKPQQTFRNNYFLCFSDFFFFWGGVIFNFQLLKGLLQKMLNYRLDTVNVNHWGFKPVFRCSKPHTFSTFSGEEKETNCPFILFNKATRELNKTTGK